MTEVIKARTDAEFVSMVPTLAGYSATNSVMCVAFQGNLTLCAFRISLPSRRRLSDYRAVSSWMVDALARLPGVDGVAPVIYTDRSFRDEAGVPWLDFSRHLIERLHNEGFHLPGVFCVAADGWANYLDRGAPRAGHPLEQLTIDASVPSIDLMGRLPEVTAPQRKSFARALASLEDGSWSEQRDDLTPRSWVDTSLECKSDVLPDEMGAHLLLLAQSPARRDEITVHIAFGEQLPIDACDPSIDDALASLLMGRGNTKPDVDRVQRAIAILSRLVALAPDAYRVNPLCILAWLTWSLGLTSAAGSHIDMALEIDPDHGMAQILLAITSHGRLPDWAFGS